MKYTILRTVKCAALFLTVALMSASASAAGTVLITIAASRQLGSDPIDPAIDLPQQVLRLADTRTVDSHGHDPKHTQEV